MASKEIEMHLLHILHGKDRRDYYGHFISYETDATYVFGPDDMEDAKLDPKKALFTVDSDGYVSYKNKPIGKFSYTNDKLNAWMFHDLLDKIKIPHDNDDLLKAEALVFTKFLTDPEAYNWAEYNA